MPLVYYDVSVLYTWEADRFCGWKTGSRERDV